MTPADHDSAVMSVLRLRQLDDLPIPRSYSMVVGADRVDARVTTNTDDDLNGWREAMHVTVVPVFTEGRRSYHYEAAVSMDTGRLFLTVAGPQHTQPESDQ